jgi:hypothetical protein
MEQERAALPEVFESKRHDTGISPELTFTPPAGVTWDLTEAGLTVKFIARLPDAPTPKINAAAVVTGPWTVRYDPTATDVDTIGAYDVEVQATRSNGKKFTMPTVGFLQWVIHPDLDNA